MKYIIEISGYATELCAGTVDDKKVFEFLKNEGDYCPDHKDAFKDENGNSVDIMGYEYDNIFHAYGAHTNEATINVYAKSDEEEFSESYDATEFDQIYHLFIFEYSCYQLDFGILKKEGNFAIYQSTYTERGLIAEFELETENFNPKYLRVVNVLVEEVASTDYIIYSLLYISDEDLLEIYNKEAKKYNETRENKRFAYDLFTLDDFEKDKNECLGAIWDFFYEIFKEKYKLNSSIEEYLEAYFYAQDEFNRIFGAYRLNEGNILGYDTWQSGWEGRLIEL